MDKSHLLISGTMRSGTTWMSSVVNNSPECAIISDILNWYWHRLFMRYGKMESIYELDKAFFELEPFILYGANPIQQRSFIDGDIKKEIIQKGVSYQNIYLTFVQIWSGKSNFRVIGDKTTHAYPHYGNFLRMFDNSYVLHMVRNPLDIYKSHKKRTEDLKNKSRISWLTNFFSKYARVNQRHLETGIRMWSPYVYENPISIVDEWVISLKEAFILKKEFPDRIQIIKYEDFTTEPVKVLDRITEMLGAGQIQLSINELKDRNGNPFVRNTSHKNSNEFDKSQNLLNDKELFLIREKVKGLDKVFHYSV